MFDHLVKNPQFMSPSYQKKASQVEGERLSRIVVEYMMREMTDRDIIEEIKRVDPDLFEIMLSNEGAKDISAIL